tara:strand:- start:378 stop:845 length:468 start_codon:yes stop_codon:yes gene_type:complete
MSDNIRLTLALVLVVVGLFGEKVVNWAKDNVEIVDGTVYTITEPSLENKELVKPISETDIELKDAELISAFYLELADVIDKDDTIIDSTGQFRNLNTFAGVLHFNTSLLGKYDSLGENIDSAIVNAIGKENVKLDENKRQDLVDVLNAIAWSATQ